MIRGRRIAGERGEGRKRWLLFECGCKFTKHCVTKQDKLAARTLMQLVRGECDDDTVTEDFLVCAASLICSGERLKSCETKGLQLSPG